MGKNIKSYATTQVHFPRKREGSLTAKGPSLSFTIWYGLTVHIICFKNYKQNFQNCLPQSNSSGSCKFHTVCSHSPRTTRNSHIFVNLFYIMFQAPAPAENPAEFQRITQIPRDSPTQPANHVNSTHFALKFKYM